MRTVVVVHGSGERGDEDPEQVGRLQLLGQEVAEEQRGGVQVADVTRAQREDRQRGGRDHVRDLWTVAGRMPESDTACSTVGRHL